MRRRPLMICRCSIFLRTARSNARTAVTLVVQASRTKPGRRRSGVHGARGRLKHTVNATQPTVWRYRLPIEQPDAGALRATLYSMPYPMRTDVAPSPRASPDLQTPETNREKLMAILTRA